MGKRYIKLTEGELRGLIGDVVSNVLDSVSVSDVEVERFLSSLSSEVMNSLWVDYSGIVRSATYANPLTIAMLYRDTLMEGLIHTYPVGRTISYVKSYFGMDDGQIYAVEAENGIEHIVVIVPVIGNNVELVKKAMDLCGYYLGAPKEEYIKPNTWAHLQFEPKFQKDDTERIRNEESVLYHVTPKYNMKKIQRIGFSPRTKNGLFNYPDRVYFLRGSCDDSEITAIAEQLRDANSSEGNDGKYVLFTVDVNMIPSDVPLYLDPNYPYGVYTGSNIKPDTIVSVEEINLK